MGLNLRSSGDCSACSAKETTVLAQGQVCRLPTIVLAALMSFALPFGWSVVSHRVQSSNSWAPIVRCSVPNSPWSLLHWEYSAPCRINPLIHPFACTSNSPIWNLGISQLLHCKSLSESHLCCLSDPQSPKYQSYQVLNLYFYLRQSLCLCSVMISKTAVTVQ